MWVVRKLIILDDEWEHKYFNEEVNARTYYDSIDKKFPCGVEIEEIETEDSPNGVGASED